MMVQQPCCPTCGRGLDGTLSGTSVDLSSNTVITPIGGAKVTRRQAEIVNLLIRRIPAFLDEDRIYAGVWGDSFPAHDDQIIKVYICKIRKIIGPIGL